MKLKSKNQTNNRNFTGQVSGITGFQPVKEFRIYRKNLPHWEQAGSYYFITCRTNNGVVLSAKARNIVIDSISFHDGKKYKLYACVIMPNHVHLVIRPLEKVKGSFYSIAEIMHSIKSYSAKEVIELLNDTGKMPVLPKLGKMPVLPNRGKMTVLPNIWLDENYDRIIRDENELFERMNYIVNNPIRKGLARNPKDYKWLYVKGWLGDNSQAGMPVSPLCKKQVTGRSDIPV